MGSRGPWRCGCGGCVPGAQKDSRARLLDLLDQKREAFAPVAPQIWDFADVGYRKEKSCALCKQQMVATLA